MMMGLGSHVGFDNMMTNVGSRDDLHTFEEESRERPLSIA